MNKYLNALACRKQVYTSTGASEWKFSADCLIGNGTAFAIGFVAMFFASPHIPGLKDHV